MTKQEQRKLVAELWDEDNLPLVCEQLLEKGVEPRLILRRAEPVLIDLAKGYYYSAKQFLEAIAPFYGHTLTQEDILEMIGYVKNKMIYFYLYEKGPEYGINFDKLVVGKSFVAAHTRYSHQNFEMLVERLGFDSDDLLDIITDVDVVKTLGDCPEEHYEKILQDILEYPHFEYNINDIAARHLDMIGYGATANDTMQLVEVMGVLIKHGANIFDIDRFGENVLKLKQFEGKNWTDYEQDKYIEILEAHGAKSQTVLNLMGA